MSIRKIISPISFLVIFSFVIVSLFFFSPFQTKAQNPTFTSNIGTYKKVVTPGFSFTKDLRSGDTDPDVKELQKVLNADPDTIVSDGDVGSVGQETEFFGAATRAAVIKFQNKYKDVVLTLNGISSANGLVNKATRTRLNLLIGVINTYDSVGYPKSRGTVTVQVPSAPSFASSQTGMTACKLIELLINIGAIAPNKTVQARGAFNCSVSGNAVCQLVELLINIDAIAPGKANQARSVMGCTISNLASSGSSSGTTGSVSSVDLKINGQSGTLYLNSVQNVTVSWSSSKVNSCTIDGDNVPTYGFQNYHIDSSKVFEIICNSANGTVSDSVPVILSSLAISAGFSATPPTNNGTTTSMTDEEAMAIINGMSTSTTMDEATIMAILATLSTSTGSTPTVNSEQTYASAAEDPNDKKAFGGQVLSVAACLDSKNKPIPHRFELAIAGWPLPGALVIYDATKALPPAGFFIVGLAEGEHKCKNTGSQLYFGFKKLGVMTIFGFGI
jgi:peptidoglycan hydrolase-like protein with peptidoglycan-binding domain